MSRLPRPAVVAVVVGLVSAAVFAAALPGGWIYDDHLLIPGNPYIQSLAWWPRWFITDFWDVAEEFVRIEGRILYWRPTITATYALDWHLGGGSPVLFHVTNLAWHAGVGALAFVVLRRWIGGGTAALMAALLFALHPTKAESVAWIAGRTDVLCMFAALCVAQGVAMRLANKPGGVLLECFGTVLAYTTKEQAIVLPAFVAIEAWVQAGRPHVDRRSIVRMVKVAAPQIAVAVAYLVIRKLVMPIQAVGDTRSVPATEHIQVVLETMGRFITLATVPHDLSIQHGLVRVANGAMVHSTPYVVIGAISTIALIASAIVLRGRIPSVTVGITFYLVSIAPTSNIVNTHMRTVVSERFLYLPYLGLAFAIGALVHRWPRRWTYAVAAVMIIAFGCLAFERSSDYADEDRFWMRELELHPDSSEARRGRMRALIRQKRYQAALLDALELTRASMADDVAAAADIAQLVADLAPDHDRRALDAVDTFCRDLLARKAPSAELRTMGLSFQVPTTGKRYERQIKSFELRIVTLRMSLRSRLGDDAGAVALAKEALTACPRCVNVLTTSALTLARAGSYTEAMEILDASPENVSRAPLAAMYTMIEKSRVDFERAAVTSGPAQLQARAAALAGLELWGRAYDVLAPYKEQIKHAPRFVLGFAELAVRAGEPSVAREVLAGAMAPPEIEEHIRAWSRTMGWAN